MRRRVGCFAPIAMLATLAAASAALARVGGGGGFSSGGGGGGGGDGDAGVVFLLVRLLLWLIFRHPVIGIPVAIVVVIVLMRMARQGAFLRTAGENPTVLVGGPAPAQPSISVSPLRQGSVNLTPVRTSDPLFSEPVFLDFAQLVYARAHAMRGTGDRGPLTAWLAQEALDKLFADRVGLGAVDNVIFGVTRLTSAATDKGFVLLEVAFQANLTETRNGVPRQMLCDERWTFRRKAGVRSPAPERMRALGCASCGSTAEPKVDGACPSCGSPRKGGLTQWEVARIPYADRHELTPPELTPPGGIEPGLERPTVRDPRLQATKRAFDGKHPDFDWPGFEKLVAETFVTLQDAWTTQTWERARPLETDALFQTHRFWLERYSRFGLKNRVEETKVQKLELARIDSDAFFEAITVRVYAGALDWTEDSGGNVVSGNKSERTIFSEYWTFLRAISGTPAGPRVCPSCGAPVAATGQAIVCGYCGSKLSTDAFGWVVSRMEQDEVYAG